MNWTLDKLPQLSDKNYVLTGGNSGIGLEAAKILARAGGRVVITARDPEKGARALEEINKNAAQPAEMVRLDLSSLESVRIAADDIKDRHVRIDALINNAGVMQTPHRLSADGYELQFATNHLGHFLLSGLLFERIRAASGRVVSLSSIAHRFGRLHFDDLMLTKDYNPTRAYGQSKLANLMFALEMARQAKANNSPVAAMACHPGYAATHLQSSGPQGLFNAIYKLTNPLMAQPAEKGAHPTVLAAAGLEAQSGGYYGPTGFGEARGPVGEARIAPHAQDENAARLLWVESEKLVGLQWTPH